MNPLLGGGEETKPSQLRIESIFTQWNTIGIRGNNLIA